MEPTGKYRDTNGSTSTLVGSCQLIVILVSILCACERHKSERKLFRQVPSTSSHITFSNNIIESDTLNYFSFPYMYMGGGVAILDVNQDGLQDIFFTGNMVSDKLYLNQGNLNFEDITDDAGLGKDSRWHTGCAVGDVNQDGFPDLYIGVSGTSGDLSNLLYLNNGDLTFTECASQYGLNDEGHTVQSTFFDYDRDGFVDVFLANYPPTSFSSPNRFYQEKMKTKTASLSDKLYRNNGDNTFTDITENSGLLNFGLSLSATIGDLNNDSWPDIYVSNDFASPDYLYLNNQNGTFSDQTKNCLKHFSYFGMGTDIADFNNDGLQDIVQVDMTPADNKRSKTNMASMNPDRFYEMIDFGMHHQYMQNSLQLNQGKDNLGQPVFSEMARLAGIATTDWSWGCIFADFDNDGWKDLCVSNGVRRDINNRDFFISRKDQWIFGKEFRFDYKKLPSQKVPNYIFKNNRDLSFSDQTINWGFELETFTNGFSCADLDNDGDLELVLNNIDGEALLFENTSEELIENNFLRIQLNGPINNPMGLGACVKLFYNGNMQVRYQTLTRGFQSSVDPVLHFGIGKTQMIDSLSITWADGQSQLFQDVLVNSLIRVKYDRESNVIHNYRL